MANVWGYWDCKYCGTKHIRGDQKKCPGCGRSVDKDIHYYVDKTNISQVSKDQENNEADWICDFCDTQNKATDLVCKNCGSAREDATHGYFHREEDDQAAREAARKEQLESSYRSGVNKPKNLLPFILAPIVLIFAIIMFLNHKVDISTKITAFGWENVIHTEKFTECSEDDWELPSGARLDHTANELHHYDHVLDHYETLSREVSHEELAGYDTEYNDLGNGQFETVEVPRYETVYETEYYEEPVYRDDPVYATRYYYLIDRWITDKDLVTSAKDKKPYWDKNNYPTSIKDPKYGDIRESGRESTYTIYYENGDEKVVSEAEWNAANVGDGIGYKVTWLEAQKIKKNSK